MLSSVAQCQSSALIAMNLLVVLSMLSSVATAVEQCVKAAGKTMPAKLPLDNPRPREAWDEQAPAESSTDTDLDLPALPARPYAIYLQATEFERFSAKAATSRSRPYLTRCNALLPS
jgi:hypothetical protein